MFPFPFSDLPPARAESWARVSSIVASRRLLAEEDEGGERMREDAEDGGRVCSVVRLRSSWRERWAQGSNWVRGDEEGEASGNNVDQVCQIYQLELLRNYQKISNLWQERNGFHHIDFYLWLVLFLYLFVSMLSPKSLVFVFHLLE